MVKLSLLGIYFSLSLFRIESLTADSRFLKAQAILYVANLTGACIDVEVTAFVSTNDRVG